jgi:thioredoxin-dependent peroxiredoxin
MVSKSKGIILVSFAIFLLLGCASLKPKLSMDQSSVEPGSSVTFKGEQLKLVGTPLSIGKPLPSAKLVDAMTMKEVDLSRERGSVLFLSIVVSIDTPVCEEQTHYLGDVGRKLPEGIKRITISRDTPFAQKRFAKESKLTEISYLSDYKEGDFGRATGILIDQMMLLARSIILVDKKGVVRYIQVVPEITRFPDMDRAFLTAIELSKEP